MKALAIALLLLSASAAWAEEAVPVNRFKACVAKWHEVKAQEGYVYAKGGYKTHMAGCLRKPSPDQTSAKG